MQTTSILEQITTVRQDTESTKRQTETIVLGISEIRNKLDENGLFFQELRAFVETLKQFRGTPQSSFNADSGFTLEQFATAMSQHAESCVDPDDIASLSAGDLNEDQKSVVLDWGQYVCPIGTARAYTTIRDPKTLDTIPASEEEPLRVGGSNYVANGSKRSITTPVKPSIDRESPVSSASLLESTPSVERERRGETEIDLQDPKNPFSNGQDGDRSGSLPGGEEVTEPLYEAPHASPPDTLMRWLESHEQTPAPPFVAPTVIETIGASLRSPIDIAQSRTARRRLSPQDQRALDLKISEIDANTRDDDVITLIEDGADPNGCLVAQFKATKDARFAPPLLRALSCSNMACVKALLRFGADANCGLSSQSADGSSIWKAIQQESVETVQLLMDNGLTIASYPVSVAVSSGNTAMLEILLRYKASLKLTDLADAVKATQLGIVRIILKSAEQLLKEYTSPKSWRQTLTKHILPLCFPVTSRHPNEHPNDTKVLHFSEDKRGILKALLDQGALADEDHLRFAIRTKDIDLLDLLLRHVALSENNVLAETIMSTDEKGVLQLLLAYWPQPEQDLLDTAVDFMAAVSVDVLLEHGVSPSREMMHAAVQINLLETGRYRDGPWPTRPYQLWKSPLFKPSKPRVSFASSARLRRDKPPQYPETYRRILTSLWRALGPSEITQPGFWEDFALGAIATDVSPGVQQEILQCVTVESGVQFSSIRFLLRYLATNPPENVEREIMVLLTRSVEVEVRGNGQYELAVEIARGDSTEIFKLLFKPESTNQSLVSCIPDIRRAAAAARNLNLLGYLLDASIFSTDFSTESGRSEARKLLISAAKSGDVEVVNLVIRAGVELNLDEEIYDLEYLARGLSRTKQSECLVDWQQQMCLWMQFARKEEGSALHTWCAEPGPTAESSEFVDLDSVLLQVTLATRPVVLADALLATVRRSSPRRLSPPLEYLAVSAIQFGNTALAIGFVSIGVPILARTTWDVILRNNMVDLARHMAINHSEYVSRQMPRLFDKWEKGGLRDDFNPFGGKSLGVEYHPATLPYRWMQTHSLSYVRTKKMVLAILPARSLEYAVAISTAGSIASLENLSAFDALFQAVSAMNKDQKLFLGSLILEKFYWGAFYPKETNMFARRSTDTDRIEYILDGMLFNHNFSDLALLMAARFSNWRLVRDLISRGAGVNGHLCHGSTLYGTDTSFMGCSALYTAITSCNVEAVKMLVEAGADVNNMTHTNRSCGCHGTAACPMAFVTGQSLQCALETPLYRATLVALRNLDSQSVEIIRVLLAAGARPSEALWSPKKPTTYAELYTSLHPNRYNRAAPGIHKISGLYPTTCVMLAENFQRLDVSTKTTEGPSLWKRHPKKAQSRIDHIISILKT